MTEDIVTRATTAFAAYTGLGRRLIDELIAEVNRLRGIVDADVHRDQPDGGDVNHVPTCHCGHVWDEHDLSVSHACTIDGCGCIHWELDQESVLQVRVGRFYRAADGEVHGPMRIDPKYPDRFTDEYGNWYGADGHFWQQNQFCPFRLVEEAEDHVAGA